MKRLGLVLLAVVVVAGLAGCEDIVTGGVDECISYYCDFFCDKVVDCGLLPASEVASCVSICAASASGMDEAQCQQTFSAAMEDSCDDTASLLGLRSALGAPGTLGCFVP